MGARGVTTRPRCLESVREVWDNRPVSKYSSVVVTLLMTIVLGAGCQKPEDLGRMQEETVAMVQVYARDLETEQRRADTLLQRGRQAGGDAPGIADAGRVLGEARSQLDTLRALASSAPTLVATAAKTGKVEEVQKVNDDTLEKLDAGLGLVRADLDAVENWVMAASERPRGRAAQPPISETQQTGIPCVNEIALRCPEGLIDGCLKVPQEGDTHRCVPAAPAAAPAPGAGSANK